MSPFDRREFLQFSAASLLLTDLMADAGPAAPGRIAEHQGVLRVEGADFRWEWSKDNDEFRLIDKYGLSIANGKMQPAVVVEPAGQKGDRRCTSGKVASHEVHDRTLTIRYEGVNGSGKLTLTWRFDDDGFWLEPVVYESAAAEDVVSFHFFAEGTGDAARPVFPAGRYKVRSAMTGKPLGTVAGNQFSKGISVTLPADYKVEVLEVRLP